MGKVNHDQYNHCPDFAGFDQPPDRLSGTPEIFPSGDTPAENSPPKKIARGKSVRGRPTDSVERILTGLSIFSRCPDEKKEIRKYFPGSLGENIEAIFKCRGFSGVLHEFSRVNDGFYGGKNGLDPTGKIDYLFAINCMARLLPAID